MRIQGRLAVMLMSLTPLLALSTSPGAQVPTPDAPAALAASDGPSSPSSSTSPGPPPAGEEASPLSTAPTEAPATEAPPPPSEAATPAEASPAPSVQVTPLARLDLFSTGRDAGLGPDLWKGSSADIARQIIPALGRHPLSPAATRLALRLLSQAARAPDGAGADAALAAARARALLALGDAAIVDSIADRTADLAANGDLSRAAAEAALITDQNPKACAISDALTVDRDQVYWLRLRAFCQVLAGKPDAAQLTFTLANQQLRDPIYARLMGVLLAGAGDPGAPSLRDGLDYALSRQLKLDLEPAVPKAGAAIAAHLAASIPPPPPPAGSEADLLAVVRKADTPARFMIAAKVVAPGIAALVQARTVLAAPVQMATAALAAGDLATAQAILAALPQDAPDVDSAILEATLTATSPKPDPTALARLVERAASVTGKDRARAQAAAVVVAALADLTDGPTRAALAQFELGRDETAPARLLALDIAAAEGLAGETGLLALAIAEPGGETGPKPADRARVVRALRLAGLAEDARAFAVEGLIALQSR